MRNTAFTAPVIFIARKNGAVFRMSAQVTELLTLIEKGLLGNMRTHKISICIILYLVCKWNIWCGTIGLLDCHLMGESGNCSLMMAIGQRSGGHQIYNPLGNMNNHSRSVLSLVNLQVVVKQLRKSLLTKKSLSHFLA